MSTRNWFLMPDVIIGQSPNGPGSEGGLNAKMAKPSTLALTGGNTDTFPIKMNPGPENRMDPILPAIRFPNEGRLEDGTLVANFPGTKVGRWVGLNPSYGLLFHFVTPPNYFADAANVNQYVGFGSADAAMPLEWVSRYLLMTVTDAQPDPATGGFVFESSLSDQFVGLQSLQHGGIWSSDPGEFYMTLWAYFNPAGTAPYGMNGGFFQMGGLPNTNSCQLYFYMANNVPKVDLFFGTDPLGANQSATTVPMLTFSYVTDLSLTGQGLYQIGFYYKNDGRNITVGGSIGSMDPVVNFGADTSGNGTSRLQFIPPVVIPAPYGKNSLVCQYTGGSGYQMGFSSTDPNYGTPFDFVAYRTVIENTAATGNDPISQIVADFNHFGGMVYTPVDSTGAKLEPVVGLEPTLNAVYLGPAAAPAPTPF